jgi:hypothetical protein
MSADGCRLLIFDSYEKQSMLLAKLSTADITYRGSDAIRFLGRVVSGFMPGGGINRDIRFKVRKLSKYGPGEVNLRKHN